jgi:hypothetical protein
MIMDCPIRQYPKIPRETARARYPLSFQQERVLYFCQLEPDSTMWDLNTCKRLKGEMHVPVLRAAIDQLAARHIVLQTRIFAENGTAFQAFQAPEGDLLKVIDLTTTAPAQRERAARQLLSQECRTPISKHTCDDLLFKVVLYQIDSADCMLLLKLHHIIADAATIDILWRDLQWLYNGLLSGGVQNTPSPPPKINYGDYALWQRRLFDEPCTREQEAYWLGQFDGALPVLDLPSDYPAQPGISFRGGLEIVTLPKPHLDTLQTLGWQHRVMLFSTLFSAFYVLLHKYAQQDDIVIGTLFSGRHYHPELIETAGFFINTTALRMTIEDDLTFVDLLKQVHHKIDEAYYMQDCPFERIIQKVNPDRGKNRMPLFRTMFNMVTETKQGATFEGIHEEKWIDVATQTSATQADLIFDIHNNAHDAEIRIEFNSDLFRRGTVRRFAAHYINLLRAIAAQPTPRQATRHSGPQGTPAPAG